MKRSPHRVCTDHGDLIDATLTLVVPWEDANNLYYIDNLAHEAVSMTGCLVAPSGAMVDQTPAKEVINQIASEL